MTGRTGGIPESIVEEIIARNDIVSVVGQYVRFTKTSGQNQFGLCPFHSEDTPSFSVSTSKQIFYCFGCHKGGNVIHFIMEIEKCGYLDALKILAERAQVRLPEPEDDNYRKEAQLRDRVKEALVEAARYFYTNLYSNLGISAREYLTARAISPSTAKAFGLGYAPDQWTGLLLHLRKKGYSDEVLSQCGLFTKGKKQGELIDLFRGRLMFPIFDTLGKIIAFGGRIIGEGNPKYINSPESVVYSKQRNLYGLNFAKTTKEKKMIIVEGYMDVITMHQAGVKNAVASLGTALTERQLDLLSRYTEEVVLFYDSDSAGQAAAMRGLKMLLQRGKKYNSSASTAAISVALVPDGKDPDQYIREHGADAFKKIVADAYFVLAYLLMTAEKQSTENGKLDPRTYQNLACTYLSWENNLVLREHFAAKPAAILGVSVERIMQESSRIADEKHDLERQESDRVLVRQVSVLPKMNEGDSARQNELVLLCLLSGMNDEYADMEDHPIPTDFSAGTMREIAAEALDLLDKKALSPLTLLELGEGRMMNGRAAKDVLSELLMRTQSVKHDDKRMQHVMDYLYQIRINVYTSHKNELARCLDLMPEGPDKSATKEDLLKVDRYLKYLREKRKES